MISIVVPFHNEEANVRKVINDLAGFLRKSKLKGEIIAVDDRSSDATGQILDELAKRLRFLRVVHRKGRPGIEVGFAIRDGIGVARHQLIATMMGDGSDDPADLPKLLEKLREGYDVVCGSRFVRGGKAIGYPFLKLLFHRIYNKFLSLFFGLGLEDFSNAFKAYRRRVFDRVVMESKGFEFSVEIVLKSALYGFRLAEVPVSWTSRKAGRSKLGSFGLSPRFLILELPRLALAYGLLPLRILLRT
jgi:dolichol-phosphate mannosyltransferase